jgi:hypothetical protein
MTRYIVDRLLLALTLFLGMLALLAAMYGFGGSLQPGLLVWRNPDLPEARTAYEAFYHQAGWLTFAVCVVTMLALATLRRPVAGPRHGLRHGRLDD